MLTANHQDISRAGHTRTFSRLCVFAHPTWRFGWRDGRRRARADTDAKCHRREIPRILKCNSWQKNCPPTSATFVAAPVNIPTGTEFKTRSVTEPELTSQLEPLPNFWLRPGSGSESFFDLLKIVAIHSCKMAGKISIWLCCIRIRLRDIVKLELEPIKKGSAPQRWK